MINYKQLAIDLIAIQAEAVGRGTELLERAKKGEFDVRVKQCFEEDIRRNHSREDRDLYGQAARDTALAMKVRNLVKDRPRDENLLTDNMYKAHAFDQIVEEVEK